MTGDHTHDGEHVNQYTSDTNTNTYTLLLITTAIIESCTVKMQILNIQLIN